MITVIAHPAQMINKLFLLKKIAIPHLQIKTIIKIHKIKIRKINQEMLLVIKTIKLHLNRQLFLKQETQVFAKTIVCPWAMSSADNVVTTLSNKAPASAKKSSMHSSKATLIAH